MSVMTERRHRGVKIRRTALAMMAVLLAATSCGTSTRSEVVADTPDAEVAEPTAPVDAPAEQPTTEQEDAQTQTEPAPADDAGAAVGEPADLLAAALAADPVLGGWPLAPGRWGSPLFSTAIAVSTDRPLLVSTHAQGLLVLQDPTSSATVSILEPGSASLPPQRVVPWSDSWAETLATEPGITAVDGPGEVAHSFALVASDDHVEGTCDCVVLLATSEGWTPSTDIGRRIEVAIPAIEGTPFAVMVDFTDADAEESTGLARAIAASLTVIEEEHGLELPPMQPLQSLVRDQPIPPGHYVTHLNDFVLEIMAPVELDARQTNVTNASASFFWGDFSGSINIANPAHLISTEWGQPPGFPSLEDLVASPPATVSEMAEWISSTVAIIDEGEMSVGDMDAYWWDVAVSENDDSQDCAPGQGPPEAQQCVAFILNDNGVWSLFDSHETRLLFVEDAGALFTIENWSGGVSDVWTERIQPIIDTMAVTPVT